ncbi:MAG: RIP metalloprotease RseP [bacterium]|nr:RIP metalloprotease RseP [bacterium]
MTVILNILLFVFILGFIIFVHEFGHFIWAKITGVYVYEFALGMGPKIFSKKGKETEYTLRAIPIGGFCQLAGEDVDDDKLKKIPEDRRLQSKSAFQRFLIMFFGAGNNFISAILILFMIALIFGGVSMNPVITGVDDSLPAFKAGIKEGDVVVKINGNKVTTSDDISLFLSVADPEKTSSIVVRRDDELLTFKVKPKKIKENNEESYRYGIMLQQEKETGLVNAFKYTFNKTKSIFKQMTYTVVYLFTGGIKLNQLSGPVGIYSIVGEQSKTGIANVLYLVAFLSINVGFINLLPLPAFDGGHILFIIIEKIKGSPVSPELENKIHTVGLMLLMLLMLVVTINDILRLF